MIIEAVRRAQRTAFTKQACASDRGSTLPFIIILAFLALVFVAGVTVASSSFLTLRELQVQCDGAALAAGAVSSNLDERDGEVESVKGLAQEKVNEYRNRVYEGSTHPPRMVVQMEGSNLIVECEQKKPVAFGTLFGYKDGVKHYVTSTVYAREQ